MAPKNITCLPPEIMTTVIDMLGSQGARYNFLRSCRFGYIYTLPTLYRDVELWTRLNLVCEESSPEAACHEMHDGSPDYPQFWSMYSFANTVLGNPNRAAHVKTFTLHGSMCICPHPRYDTKGRYGVSDAIREAIERRELDDDATEEWLNAVTSGSSMDALLAVILPALPGMEKLDCGLHECAEWTLSMLSIFQLKIEDENGEDQPAYKMLLPPGALGKLHTVTNQADMDFCRKMLFLSLPAIKCLAGECKGYDYPEGDEVEFVDYIEYMSVDLPDERPYSVAEEINLHLIGNCLIDIQKMVESCYALKTLKLTLTYGETIFYALRRFQEALSPARHTLETLELLYTPIEPMTWEEDPMDLDLGGFTKLRDLKLGTAFVFGRPALIEPHLQDLDSDGLNNEAARFAGFLTDTLPSTIQALYLRRYRDEALSGIALFKNLGDLLENIPIQFHFLKSVTVDIARKNPNHAFGKNFDNFWRTHESVEDIKGLEERARDHSADLKIREILEE